MDHRVQHILSLIEADPGRKRGRVELAQAVNLSCAQVYLLFKQHKVGKAPMSYRKHLKMEYAAGVLASEFVNVQQVRIRAGFKDDSHFTRDFKKIFGMTPKQYQRLHFEGGNGHMPASRAVSNSEEFLDGATKRNGHESKPGSSERSNHVRPKPVVKSRKINAPKPQNPRKANAPRPATGETENV